MDPCARMDPISVTRPVAWAKSWVHAGLVIGQTRMVPGFISSKCSADSTSEASPTIVPGDTGKPSRTSASSALSICVSLYFRPG